MAVSLRKGQAVTLKADQYDLSKVTFGLGWKTAAPKKHSLLHFLTKKEDGIDLDAVAFLLNANNKIENMGPPLPDGQPALTGADIVFFNNLRHASGVLWLTGDSRTGSDATRDDEQIIALLGYMNPKYHKIVVVVQIYQGIKRQQSFGNVEQAYIHAVDAKGVEMLRFDLARDREYANCQAMVFAEIERIEGNNWEFKAIGRGLNTDNLRDILRYYT
jgi:stress response protein SCP2